MNGATRSVHIWLGNDEALYREVEALAATSEDAAALAAALKAWVTDLVRVPESGLRSELLNDALSTVDWHELAETWIEDDDDEEDDFQEPSPDPNWMNP